MTGKDAALNTRLDHLVIGAPSLEQGVTYVKERLGVDIPVGGAHPAMGTHNHLMQLGNETFLEVIAVNPNAPAPATPRWYGLDDPFVRAQLKQQPRLLTWVVNTADIKALQARASFSFGVAVPVSRGALSWHFGVPDDGRLLAGGMLPYLIMWHTDTHPSSRMGDAGCRLRQLHIYHPQRDWLLSVLSDIGAETLVEVEALQANTTPYLVAHIDTPSGLKTLSSRLDETLV